jgi:DNA replication and repair protein RecF
MLSQVELTNFRNYQNKTIDFTNTTTVITGKNAIGKTNIIEAIFTSLFTKSFRAADSELITTSKDFFRIKTTISKTPIILHYTTSPKPTKTLKINSQKTTLRKSIGTYPVILFEPNTILLFSLSPSYRRKYLDTILYQLDSYYVEHAITYNKTLKQRNTWLRAKKIAGVQAKSDEQIFIYNIQLSTSGSYITKRRQELLRDLEPYIQTYYQEIAKETKNITIDFRSSNSSEEDLLKKIESNWLNDTAVGRTLIGPHREDFIILFHNQSILSHASRGEVRSVLLALKFAELQLFHKISKNPPLLLLDDVFSELDEYRQKMLINQTIKFQSIITATHLPKNIIKNFQLIELPI